MTTGAEFAGFLGGIRVLEVGAELGEYCGKVLAGLGADVVRVEPPGGEQTRGYGPFRNDVVDPDQSLYFWHYNFAKRSIVLDLDDPAGQAEFARLAEVADVVLDSRPRTFLSERGIGAEQLEARNPRLIYTRISPFGDTGPWADFTGSDLIHLALGGVMMNCGYDPDPDGAYETPPIAPQMWQAYQIAGEMAVMSIIAALIHRLGSGTGQRLTTSVHQSVSQNTETDVPDWLFLGQKHLRLTCRHSTAVAGAPALSITKDGRYVLPYRTYVNKGQVNAWDGSVELLRKYGMQSDLDDARFDGDLRHTIDASDRLASQIDKLVGRLMFDRDVWRDAQALGLPWAPVRRPEENAVEQHWLQRETFIPVEHPELGESYLYTGGKWVTEGMPWRAGPRPPLLGEHSAIVSEEWSSPRPAHARQAVTSRSAEPPLTGPSGAPFALSGVRVVDLSWMLASAGAGRFLAAMGADVIKVEHISRPDGMRFTPLGACPPGGRAERDAATGPLETPDVTDNPNRSGFFMEINSGKRSMSLNLKTPQGRQILEDLIRDADMIVEGFSPGTMKRMGLGYERLREINPRIIYVQQSGLGEKGTYGNARTYGPSAQAIAGISDMSGLPAPFAPAGIGYSYLDWFGAYNMANAMLAALYRRDVTGEGCHIDASQGDTGIYLTGTTILDHSVNGRSWARYGNRSPYKPAAPHGAYRTAGDDRWIAIGAFSDEHWQSLVEVLDRPEWVDDPRFVSLDARLAHQDELDLVISQATAGWEGYELMAALQAKLVPAGVCQSAQDRLERDPQLAHLGWTVELDQTELGRWPVKQLPTELSVTPTHIGGRLNRSGPNYGEHTDAVLSDILHLSHAEIAALRAASVID